MTESKITGFADLLPLIDTCLYRSEPLSIDQLRIEMFAVTTGDKNPIHIDPEHCAAGWGLPGIDTTISHGMLTASIAVGVMQSNLVVHGHDVYVRDLAAKWVMPVPSGSMVVVEVVMTDDMKARPRTGSFEFWVRCNVYLHEVDRAVALAATVNIKILAVKREAESKS